MRQFFTTIIAGLSFSVVSGVSIQAQEASISVSAADGLMTESIGLMEKSEWKSALDRVSKLITSYGNSDQGVRAFGPKFGVAYYYQGLCQLKLGQRAKLDGKVELAKGWFEKSISALETCYTIKNTESAWSEGNANHYRVKSLLLKGNAEQGSGQFSSAIQSYEKFVRERNNIRDAFVLSDLHINLAICYWGIGDEKSDAKAEALYLQAMQASYLPADTRSRITALKVMIESYLTRGKRSELEGFMKANRGHFAVSIKDSVEGLAYTSSFSLELAKMDLPETFHALVNAIPGKEFQLIDEIDTEELEKVVDESLGEVGVLNEVDLDGIYESISRWDISRDERLEAIKNAEQLAICARAIQFEEEGFMRGAYNAYRLLLENEEYAESRHRGDYLYNAARLALLAGATEKSYSYGFEFLNNHREHKNHRDLQRILMLTYFAVGEYGKCNTLSEEFPLSSEAELSDQDWYLYTAGGSAYYESEFVRSEKLLALHGEKFAESEYQETRAFLYASTLGKLRKWKKSIELLDAYIQSAPKERELIPFAHFNKAHVYYSMQDYKSAKAELAVFQTGFKESIIKPEAHILLGNIYRLERERTKAITEYKAAILAAKRVKNHHAKEEAYYLVTSLLGERTWDGLSNPRLLETIPIVEQFLAEPAAEKSPYYTQIITASFEALDRAKRKNEAYDALEKAIFLYNQQPNTAGVESAIKTYTIAKRREEVSDEDVVKTLRESQHLKNIPYHTGLIEAIELEVLELSQKLSPKDERLEWIKQRYISLHVEHDIEVLDNFVLIKVAEYMKKHGGIESDQNAKRYYQAIIDSKSNIKRAQAFTGMAIELANSTNVDDRELAMQQFTAIVADPFTDKKAKADAHYQLIEILYKEENYAELSKQIRSYLQYPSAVKEDIRRVEMLLAISYDQQGLKDKAIGAYNAVWVNSFENLDQSAPAIDRIIDLIWERNNPAKEGFQDGKSDKQVAYETAYKYISRTENHYNVNRTKLTQEGIQAWESIKDKIIELESDGDVKILK